MVPNTMNVPISVELQKSALCAIADAKTLLSAEAKRAVSDRRLTEAAALSIEIAMESAEFHLKLGNALRLRGEIEILHLRLGSCQGGE
jgi:hypothetical protein